MKLIIDNRERELIDLIPELLKTNKLDYDYEIKSLELGDIIIYNEEEEKEEIIIERKNLNDLASSILDGRYAEQSLRLDSVITPNHNIIYLIEGQMSSYNNRYSRVDKKTLYSTMFSLNYYKGFSVLRSINIYETSNVIIRILDKLSRDSKKGKIGYYNKKKSIDISNNDRVPNEEEPINELKQYSRVIKKRKKDNISPENIGEIILSQIPGISSVISIAIMKKYGSIYNLLMKIRENK